MSLDAGVDMGLEGRFTGDKEILTDSGKLIGWAQDLGHFHGMFLAFGGANEFEDHASLGGWWGRGDDVVGNCFVHVANIAHHQNLSTLTFFKGFRPMYWV